MKCGNCKVEMEKRVATDERPYRYKLSGLNDLALSGIQVYACPKCHHETPVIPRAAELHSAIAGGIIRQPRALRGDEIRFLRKHAGLAAQNFARLIGVTPQHLSRIENGQTKKLGQPTDRLVRTLTLTAKEGRQARAILLSIADAMASNRKGRKQARVPYVLGRQGWRRSA